LRFEFNGMHPQPTRNRRALPTLNRKSLRYSENLEFMDRHYLVLPMASGWLVGIAVVQAAFFSDANPSPGALWAASTRAEAGFMLSTIDVGIRIVVPRSFVVS